MRSFSIAAVVVAIVVFLVAVVVCTTGIWPHSLFAHKDEEIKEPKYVNTYIDSMADLHRAFPTQADIVFVGDSRVQLAQWQDIFPNASVANRGIGSDTLEGLMERVDTLGIRNPELVILEMGANDILLKHPLEKTVRMANQAIARLSEEAGRLVVLEVIDCAVEICDRREVAALNVQMRALAKKHGAQFVELNSRLADPNGLSARFSHDGLHLNAEGYRELADILCAQIEELSCQNKVQEGAGEQKPAGGLPPVNG
ncbi:GDSL-type esterase/lipase family protein [Xanthobacter sp. TB0139]|uniref:GDSL-type esterase/lipase family protein n=1 Tax=Xanthobacter sp. TB0139 TaxID=3459178 RepID=UPI004039E26E